MDIKSRIDGLNEAEAKAEMGCVLNDYGWKRERKTLELIDNCQKKFDVLRGKTTIVAYSLKSRRNFIQSGDDKIIAEAAVEAIAAIKMLCKAFGVKDEALKEAKYGHKGTD